MIDAKSYTIEWITDLRNKLGKRIDRKLIEKVIYALTFLEQLRLSDLNFVFKGGTPQLLATETPKRWKGCYTFAERDIKPDEFKHLQLGIKNFMNFIIDRFSIEEAITASAKVAYDFIAEQEAKSGNRTVQKSAGN